MLDPIKDRKKIVRRVKVVLGTTHLQVNEINFSLILEELVLNLFAMKRYEFSTGQAAF